MDRLIQGILPGRDFLPVHVRPSQRVLDEDPRRLATQPAVLRRRREYLCDMGRRHIVELQSNQHEWKDESDGPQPRANALLNDRVTETCEKRGCQQDEDTEPRVHANERHDEVEVMRRRVDPDHRYGPVGWQRNNKTRGPNRERQQDWKLKPEHENSE